MTYHVSEFGGHAAVTLEAGDVRLVAATSVGPRILGLLGPDGANALAELPDLTLPCPGSDACHLYGGHRLWAAPEVPAVTYRPEDAPVLVEEVADGIRLTGPIDPIAGTQRDITVQVLAPARFSLTHRVVNRSEKAQDLAPWAITMVPPGGRAWLPLLTTPFDEGGFQAQRNIVLWPYSRLDDPRLRISDTMLEVRTDGPDHASLGGRVKVGASLRRGWAAHWRDGSLFVIRAFHREDMPYADLGASAQLYACDDFTELETLGSLGHVDPGEAAVHVEEWQLYHADEAEAERLVMSGELDRQGGP